MVAVFCQALSVFPISDGGDLFPGSSAINLLPLMLGFFLAPELVQVFFEGRRPVRIEIFDLVPDFGQVFVKAFLAKDFCLDA